MERFSVLDVVPDPDISDEDDESAGIPKIPTDGGEDSPDDGNGKICRNTSREYFRETMEHAKVPTDEGEATLEDLTDIGEEFPAMEHSLETPQVPTDVGEKVPVVKEMVDKAKSYDDEWEFKNYCQ